MGLQCVLARLSQGGQKGSMSRYIQKLRDLIVAMEIWRLKDEAVADKN